MKKIFLKPLVLFASAAFLFSGCAGLNKMKKNADQIQFKVTLKSLKHMPEKLILPLTAGFLLIISTRRRPSPPPRF